MTASFWRWWGPLIAYMAFIFWMSSRRRPGLFEDTPDYLLHAGAYFVLAVLAVRALAEGLLRKAPARTLVGGALVSIVYGASDEWHQMHVPGRVGSVADVVADAVGSIAAVAALGLFWRFRVSESAPQAGMGRSGDL